MQHLRSTTAGAKPGVTAGNLTLTWSNFIANTLGTTTHTYNNFSIGSASADRYIITAIVCPSGGSFTVSAAEIDSGGGYSSLTHLANTANNSSGFRYVAFYGKTVASGTSANVRFTFNTSVDRSGVGVWYMTGANTDAIYSSVADNNPPLDLDLNMSANGVAMAISHQTNNSSTAATWTGYTERYDSRPVDLDNYAVSLADYTATSAETPHDGSISWSGSANADVALAISFQPIPGTPTGDWGEGQLAINLADGYVYTANANLTSNTFPVGTHANVQIFTASDTWNKPTSGTVALVQCWGAGGSGAFCYNVANGAGGGGGGGYSWGIFPLSVLGTTETITIGLGGAAKTTNSAGDAGGTSSFGSWMAAYGGAPGSNVILNGICGGGHGGGFQTPNTVTSPTGFASYYNPTRNYFALGNTGKGAYTATASNNGVSGFGGGGGAANGTTQYQAGGAAGGGSGGGGAGRPLQNPVLSGGEAVLHEFGIGANGGAGGNNTTSGSGGSYPGGGGGGASNTTSGAGANGKITVIVW